MQQFRYVAAYINYVKKKYPHIKTILGGTHAILKPDCIQEVQGLDAICISEGEQPLLDFVNSIDAGGHRTDIPSIYFRADDEIITNPNSYAVSEEDMALLPHQDRLVFPRFRRYEHSKRINFNVRVLWGRGCPYACSYCSVPSLRKAFKEPLKASKTKWVRYPPVEKAIEEIELLRDRWEFDKFIIDDDVFTTRKNWVMEFADKYPSHLKDKLQFEANLRVESVDKEIMQALKDTGCSLLKFGLENGNYDVRRKILKRPISDDRIIQVFDWAHEVGIPAHTFNIVGIPTETRETIWETINLNRRIRPARAQVSIFFPYVGTPLGNETIDNGLLTTMNESYFSGKSSTTLESLSAKEVERFAKWFKFLIYYPYAPRLAWEQAKYHLFDTPKLRISRRIDDVFRTLRQRGLVQTVVKIFDHLGKGHSQRPIVLQVETMGSDGERPHNSTGLQNLEDLMMQNVTKEQYDIEDMDANQPYMDAKV